MEIKIKIKDFYDLVKNDGGSYEILTPDGFKPIGNVYKKNNRQLYSIELESGLLLTGSDEHLVKIYTIGISEELINSNLEIINEDTWLKLSNITKNDIVVTNSGNSKVKNIFKLEKGTTYDLEVMDDKHQYYSNNIVSHNCGKSAIASGLAIKIYEKKVPRSLIGKRIIEMDMASMVAGTKFRGQFEERVKELIKEIESNPGIILFIDEIHTMVGAGSTSGSMDASNMFKPSLARGTVQCIGATTIDEYRKFVEKDGALERRFQKVMIGATSTDETIHILNNIKDRYEDHHLVKYTDGAIKACVTLTNRYISGRCLPDKAIDAMDEAGAKVHIGNVNVPPKITKLEAKMDKIKQSKKKCVEAQKFEEAAEYRDEERKITIELEEAKKEWLEKSQKNRQTVTEEHIAEVVAMMTGIPVTRISQNESAKLLTMKADLQKEVIGQDEAIDKMVKCIQRNRAGLKDPKRPIGSFIFLGTSGVGKCVTGDTYITLRNKKTGKIEKIDINSFIYRMKNTDSSKK